jgi:hypothetical protein
LHVEDGLVTGTIKRVKVCHLSKVGLTTGKKPGPVAYRRWTSNWNDTDNKKLNQKNKKLR